MSQINMPGVSSESPNLVLLSVYTVKATWNRCSLSACYGAGLKPCLTSSEQCIRRQSLVFCGLFFNQIEPSEWLCVVFV